MKFFNIGLWRLTLRYLRQNWWQSIFMLIGIILGVAVVVSVDIANTSSTKAFELSKQTILGKATHQITGGTKGIPTELYVELRKKGLLEIAAPLIRTSVSSPQIGSIPLELLGIDPFVDHFFRSYLGGEGEDVTHYTKFLTQPGTILISSDTAERYSLQMGQEISLVIEGKEKNVQIIGFLSPQDELSQRALSGVVLSDISTAQELLGQNGFIHQIDLFFENEKNPNLIKLKENLPEGYSIVSVVSRNQTLEQMTAAFKTNLSALSLLSLTVGLFMIYNTMTYSIVKRRRLFGLLRSLGVTRQEIVGLVATESMLVGLSGSILGILVGIFLGKFTVSMVSQTINDLYYATSVQINTLAFSSLLKGFLLGLIATVFTALFPALEASNVAPQTALSRSSIETKTSKILNWLAFAGLLLMLVSYFLFKLNRSSLVFGFAGTLVFVLGFALESGFLLVILMRILQPISGKIFGFSGKLASRNLVKNISRTSVAIAALMVSVAVSIGMSLMIGSFRNTVKIWLDETLKGDIYISVPDFIETTPMSPIAPTIVDSIGSWPGVLRMDTLRSVIVESDQGPVTLNATYNPDFGEERQFRNIWRSEKNTWESMIAGEILVSEALAQRLDLFDPETSLTLLTAEGWKDFRIKGIIYEYTSSEGSIWMNLDVYKNLWHDPALTAVSVRLQDGVNADALSKDFQDNFSEIQKLNIRPNQVLKDNVLEVFDRTFAITNALRILATIVAFFGVLNTSLLLQMEKQRELGILRALGLIKKQLWTLVLLESGLMGVVSGLLAAPLGYALAFILIRVINQRSFGWSLQMFNSPVYYIQGLLVAFLAAILAGIYPAWRLNRMQAAEAIRYE